MSVFRQAALGVFAALLSSLVVLGAFALSMAEGGLPVAQAFTPTHLPGRTGAGVSTPAVLTPISTPLPGEPADSASPVAPAAAGGAAAVAVTTPTCPPPSGWNPITVGPGDSLRSLANKYDLDPAELAAANCMLTETLLPGVVLYVPGKPPAPQPPRCGPPPGWVFYTVRPGDTLYRLSLLLGVSVQQLQQANCMGGSTLIRVGQQIYVPFLPPPPAIRPSATAVPSRTPAPPTSRPTRTPTPIETEPPTEPPATQPPATEPPTEPPVTEPPTTEPPATEPPATEPPTEPPATQPPATEPPTEPPVTEPPATEPPVTQPPATEPPVTEPPATEPPAEPPISILLPATRAGAAAYA